MSATKTTTTTPLRSPFLDNCKGLLILCVVWYHCLVVYYSPTLPLGLPGLESVLLLLVMPGFSLLSGYLSNPILNPKRQDNLLSTFAAFVVFQLLNWVMGIANAVGLTLYISTYPTNSTRANATINTTTVPYPIPIFFPTVMSHIPDTKALPVTWFLLALLFWRMLTPLIVRMRRPIMTCLIVGMLGLCTDLGFGSQNIVSFLPWYAMGVSLRHTTSGQLFWHQWVLRPPRSYAKAWAQVTVSIFLVTVPLLGSVLVSWLHPQWWSNNIGYVVSHGYSCLYGLPPTATAQQCTSWYAFGTRLLFYLLSLPIIVGTLRLVPRRPVKILTNAGVNSVAIYLFHPLALFNVVTLVLVSTSLDRITKGQGAVHGHGAPPFQGAVSFVLVSLLGVMVFCLLGLDCWRCCCWMCLRPPIVRGIMVQRMKLSVVKGEEKKELEEGEDDGGGLVRRNSSKTRFVDHKHDGHSINAVNEPLL